MKRETGIILASSFGILIGLGIYGVRRFLSRKQKEYQEYYSDFHRNFERYPEDINNDGIEFLAMK